MGCFGCFKMKKKQYDDGNYYSENQETDISGKYTSEVSLYSGYSNSLIMGQDGKKHKEVSESDFEKLKLLGKGTFGKVFLVSKNTNKKLYAMKVLDKSSILINHQQDHTKTERKILEKIKHPFIVSLHYAFQTKLKLYLVTEFMQGGELFYHLRKERRFEEEKAKFYICEIIVALEYLHSQNCIYRDLKPENILLGSDGHIKLTDFGLSKLNVSSNSSDRAYTICGTPEYLAPEIILDKHGYGQSVDWWSLGVLFYDMLMGASPFKIWEPNKEDGRTGYDASIYLKKVRLPSYHTPEAIDLVDKLIVANPKNRLGYKGSLEIKNHRFFQNINWEKVYAKKIQPPLIPVIKNEMDLNNFHSMFTDENVNESSITPKENIPKEKDIYEGFTYVKKNSMLDNDERIKQ